MDAHSMWAGWPAALNSGAGLIKINSERPRSGNCSKRIGNMVNTNKPEVHREHSPVEVEFERGLPLFIQGNRVGAAICLAISRGREGDHSPGCVSGHLHDVRVIKVQDRGSRWQEPLNQLGLGIAYALNRAEAPKVRVADHQFNSGVRWGNSREIGDVPRSRGSHFQNKVAGRFIGT